MRYNEDDLVYLREIEEQRAESLTLDRIARRVHRAMLWARAHGYATDLQVPQAHTAEMEEALDAEDLSDL